MNKLNFFCMDCCKYFTKTTDTETIETEYGVFMGIVCPLCSGKAKVIGKKSILGGTSPNGIAPSAKFLNLD